MGKKSIIAIIVFILLGLTIFAFAGNDDELEDKTQNSDKQQEVSGNNTDNKENEGSTDNKTNTSTDNKVTNVNKTNKNSYSLALKAVQKLENNLTTENYNNAKKLVGKVTNTSKKAALEKRVAAAKQIIDATELLNELERIYTEDLNAKNLVNSRTFNSDNKVEEIIELVSSENAKEKLKTRMRKLNRVLNDSSKPVVTGVPENGITNQDVTLEVTDETNVTKKVLLNGQVVDSFANSNIYNLEGKYEITYTDEAFNETKVEFIIDKVAPVITTYGLVGSDSYYNQISFNLEDNYALDRYEINGENYDIPNNTTATADYQDIKNSFIEGENTIVLYDAAGNSSEYSFNYDSVLPMVIYAKNDYEDREGGRIKTTIVFSEKVEYPFDGLNWRKVSDTEYYTYFYRTHDYVINFKDVALNENSYTIRVDLSNQASNLYSSINLVDEPFYNVIDINKDTVIDGGGNTVTQIVTSADKFNFGDGTRPSMGYVFASETGENVTIQNITFKGTIQSILLGKYVGPTSSYYFNTTLNNVTIKDLEVISYGTDTNTGQNFAPAVITYGTSNLNNTVITGTKLSSFDTEGYEVFDLAAVNKSITTIDGGEIGKIYLWAQAKMTIRNAKIGEITSTPNTIGGLTIASGTTVDKVVVRNNVLNPSLTIESGATIDVVDVTAARSHNYINIDANANVNKVITIAGEKTLAEYLAWK